MAAALVCARFWPAANVTSADIATVAYMIDGNPRLLGSTEGFTLLWMMVLHEKQLTLTVRDLTYTPGLPLIENQISRFPWHISCIYHLSSAITPYPSRMSSVVLFRNVVHILLYTCLPVLAFVRRYFGVAKMNLFKSKKKLKITRTHKTQYHKIRYMCAYTHNFM